MNNFNLYFESVCADLIIESVQDIKDKLTSMGWKLGKSHFMFPLKDTPEYFLGIKIADFDKDSQTESEEDNVETESVETFSMKALNFIFTEDTTDEPIEITVELFNRTEGKKAKSLGSISVKLEELLDKCSSWSNDSTEDICKEFGVDTSNDESEKELTNEAADPDDEETDDSDDEAGEDESEENPIKFSKDEFYAFYMIFGRDVLIEYGISEEKIQAWEDANL